MKAKSVYICNSCGYRSPKWLGKCPGCNSWNTLEETLEAPQKSPSSSSTAVKTTLNRPLKINDVSYETHTRFSTGINELDRVLGGGIVPGELILVGGDPGIGKSTLLLQICENAGKSKNILYVSGEESAAQIKMRAERLGVNSQNLYLLSETNVDIILSAISDIKPDIVIIDSIQTMNIDAIASASGSVPQVRETTNALMKLAKSMNISIFIVGHVTKDGSLAGPRVLEHMVDCVLYFEGDRQLSLRFLRAVKNRFGSTNEIGVFEMCESGLKEVANPSLMLLEGRPFDISGSSIICSMEGSRGILAEIQALVTPTGFGNPRRMSSGIDLNRVLLLTAVLEKRAKINLSNSDIYINTAGGLKLDEPAIDLGICAAIASSKTDSPIPPDVMFIGEVGLGGELRTVAKLEQRLSEAAKLGFKTAIVPKQSLTKINLPKDIKIYGASTINEVINIFRRKN